jgi:hypothetical protein
MLGEVVYFYAFDVANEIVAERVGTILGERPAPLGLRLKYAAPKDVAFQRPLVVAPPLEVWMAGLPVRAQIHVFSVGVVSIVLQAGFVRAHLLELLPLHRPVLDDGRPLDHVARDLCERTCRDLSGAFVRPSATTEPEAYTVFCLAGLDGPTDTGRWLADHRTDVAGLLSGLPPDRLSDGRVAEVLRQQWSLEKTDLVVIDWDVALAAR